MREPDGSSPVVLCGSTKESLSTPCSPAGSAQHGCVAQCSPNNQNGVGAFMLMTGDHILLQATKSCKKYSEPTYFMFGGTHLLTKFCWWQLDTMQRAPE